MKLAAGTKLGRYEIVAEIGRGGMGVVYRARDPKIDRFVALKTISLLGHDPEAAPDYRERFVLEARAAGRLSHPGIVTVFDVGEEPENHDPYIVMEYVAGQSLRKLLSAESKKIAVLTALKLAQEVAEALEYAHSQGVIHRDIKPSNVLVTNDSHAKIADFGIAKLNLAQSTIPGQLWGSPAYMSPEQLNGENVDARSDLFSLGVIFYTMITGYRPFQGNSATTVCFKVVNRDPLPVTSFDAGLPPELDRLIARAMAKHPADRFQTGGEMAEAIVHFRETHEFAENGEPLNRTSKVLTASITSRTDSGFTTRRTASSSRITRKSRQVSEERLFLGGLILLLAAGSFILYRGLTANFGAPAAQIKPVGQMPAVQQPVSPMDSTLPKAAAATSKSVAKRPVGAHSTAATIEDAMLRLDFQHPFAEAEATVWIDNHQVSSQMLHGTVSKHALVLKQVRGRETESISLSSGAHLIHVRVRTPDDSYDQSKTISGNFAAQQATVLDVVCEKRAGNLVLTLH
jgi:serine/threonine protein kinase